MNDGELLNVLLQLAAGLFVVLVLAGVAVVQTINALREEFGYRMSFGQPKQRVIDPPVDGEVIGQLYGSRPQ